MSNRGFFRAGAGAGRRFLAMAAAASALVVTLPHAADAATARVRWRPGGSAGVSGYNVYVRHAGSAYDPNPRWSGTPAPDADGSLSALVPYTPASWGANYFTVVSIAGGSESGLAREFALGATDPCLVDSCSTKTTCEFRPSEECCLACDTGDPCLADACAAGDCSALPGPRIAIRRLRFRSRSATTKLALTGSFIPAMDVDPTATGARLEIHGPDGSVLYMAAIAPELFEERSAGTRYRSLAGSDAKTLTDGITRLDLQRRGSGWRLVLKAATPALADAAREPDVTVVLRLGSQCMSHLDAQCHQRGAVTACR